MTTGRINQVATVPRDLLHSPPRRERPRRPEPISHVNARSRRCYMLPVGLPDRLRYTRELSRIGPCFPSAVRASVAEAELFRTVSDEYKRYTRPTCDSGLCNLLGSQCWKLQSHHSRATAKLPSSRAGLY